MAELMNTYYIDIENKVIHQTPEAAEWHFKIFAPEEEAAKISDELRKNHNADLKTYVRSHIPFLEYHHDPQNDEYDEAIENVYKMIYQYGDEEAKEHIERMGILSEEKSSPEF